MSARAQTFILVPGASHGAWCWHALERLLSADGHRVHMPELLATGVDQTSPAIVKLETWARQVVELLEQQAEPALLVGHSRGGTIISRVAELVPERISRLVYLAAYLLPAGGTIAEEARADADSLIAANMLPADRGITCTLPPEIARQAFYNGCDPGIADFALTQLSVEPLRPLVTPLRVSAGRFGRVPRAYVECTLDRTISIAAQRRMQATWPCDPVLTLNPATRLSSRIRKIWRSG